MRLNRFLDEADVSRRRRFLAIRVVLERAGALRIRFVFPNAAEEDR